MHPVLWASASAQRCRMPGSTVPSGRNRRMMNSERTSQGQGRVKGAGSDTLPTVTTDPSGRIEASAHIAYARSPPAVHSGAERVVRVVRESCLPSARRRVNVSPPDAGSPVRVGCRTTDTTTIVPSASTRAGERWASVRARPAARAGRGRSRRPRTCRRDDPLDRIGPRWGCDLRSRRRRSSPRRRARHRRLVPGPDRSRARARGTERGVGAAVRDGTGRARAPTRDTPRSRSTRSRARPPRTTMLPSSAAAAASVDDRRGREGTARTRRGPAWAEEPGRSRPARHQPRQPGRPPGRRQPRGGVVRAGSGRRSHPRRRSSGRLAHPRAQSGDMSKAPRVTCRSTPVPSALAT